MPVGLDIPDGRADVALVVGVLVLFGGRLAFGGSDPGFEASMFGLNAAMLVPLVVAAALCAVAVKWSRPFGDAVRALVAAITFLTLAVDPTTGWDGNAWYVLPGAAFAVTAFGRSIRRRPADDDNPTLARNPLAANATSLIALLLMLAVLVFGLVLLLIFWSLSGSN